MANEVNVQKRGFLLKALDGVEWLGNKLPDPAVLFVFGVIIVWVLSAWLSGMTFSEIDPRVPGGKTAITVKNLFTLPEFASLLANMVREFVNFPPLGVVLVALLGVGVAEHSGFINAVLKSMLEYTPRKLLTPMVILVAVVSHTAADAGYVLVIPLAGMMFLAAGRHPLAGIAAAFAGVSGGFSANFIPSGIDPLLAGLTETGAGIGEPGYVVNPLCNWFFTGLSSFVIVGVGWFLTDWLIEPKLKQTPVDGDIANQPKMDELSSADRRGMICGLLAMLAGIAALVVWLIPSDSAMRDPLGTLTSLKQLDPGFKVAWNETGLSVSDVAASKPAAAAGMQNNDLITRLGTTEVTGEEQFWTEFGKLKERKPVSIEISRNGTRQELTYTPVMGGGAPLMGSIVPLIFVLFVIPGVVHGYVSGKFRSHRDVIKGMSKSMESMAYYLVLVFFAAMFIYVFTRSDIGVLLAVKGANLLEGRPVWQIICGVILLTATVNLLIGSASAKWAMLSPIFVPMLMLLGISPEFTQAAYRVGDSTTNIITPMMPYFPLVVVYCQKYFTKTGIGTVTSMMLPYSLSFLVLWSLFLLVYWQIGIPLGIGGSYEYVTPDAVAAGG